METPNLEKSKIFCLNLKIPIFIYIFFGYFLPIVVLCMKTGQIYLFRNYKPNKSINPVWDNTNFESLTHKIVAY